MKRVLAAALFFFCVSAPSLALEGTLFEQANEKYRAADFKAASELYHKFIDTGHASAAAYYNLGNAALRLGQKGEALVYYYRARRASPRDQDLRWNIQVLKNTLADRIEDKTTHPLYTPLEAVIHRVTLDELALLFSGALAALALLALLAFLSPAFRGVAGFFRRVVLVWLLLSGALFALKGWDTKDPRAVVLDRETTAYYGPSETETKAFTLHEGAEGRILDESGDWVYLSLRNKNTGWIRKNSCEIV